MQDFTSNKLYSQIEAGKFPGHAFLITGLDEQERKEAAMHLGESVLGGRCEKHPDFQLISPQGQSIKIQQIREMQHTAGLSSVTGRRVIILENADNMTLEAANSLLKILEEPPEGTFFFLTAARAETLLPTIISRCLQVNLGYVEKRIIPEWLDEKTTESILAGEEILDLFALVNTIERDREKAGEFLRFVQQYYRRKLLKAITEKHLEGLPREALILEQTLNAQEMLASNGNIRLILDVLMLKIARETESYTGLPSQE